MKRSGRSGGMMVFPGNRIDGKQTINGARGFNRKIADGFDLTLEVHCSPASRRLSKSIDSLEPTRDLVPIGKLWFTSSPNLLIQIGFM